jgi:Rrf2 family transcriptional regulator, nitric oxide-sensitive transcriptional repressor
VRVVQSLDERGYLKVMSGRSGGVRLARDPKDIRLGDVVKGVEPNLRLVECFDAETNTCPIISACGLRAYLKDALQSFLAELNKHTLAELLAANRRKELLPELFQLGPLTSPKESAGKSHGVR